VLLRTPLLGLSRSVRVRHLVERAPVSRGVVSRYVAGSTTEDAVRATRALTDAGLKVSLDHLGEDTLDADQAAATREAYVSLLAALQEEDLARNAEVSVKLSAIGQALPGDGEKVALANAQAICQAAHDAGTTVTLDMEDHTTTDSTLGILGELRQDFPTTGAVLQAYLRRTVGDCRDLATVGSRVRICKGAYDEPESVAYRDRDEIDKSYVRCLRVLMAGHGYPMVATHDPRLIAVTGALAVRYGRRSSSFEYQMLHGIRPAEQLRLAAQGETVRVYLPYGQEWYGYLVRRMAEKPANVGLFVRSLVSRG
jgi:proline dehydrogenase